MEIRVPMAIVKDIEGNEKAALHAIIDFKGLSVLEIGCGEGRLTRRYAGEAAQVTGIDPDGKAIEAAQANVPEKLKGRVSFLESTLQDFVESVGGRKFDLAIFSWSL
jgi:2-polyprenyl-3-methyl-5-hydroxy-6-metoxy-1,4-benzoquinol methylase